MLPEPPLPLPPQDAVALHEASDVVPGGLHPSVSPSDGSSPSLSDSNTQIVQPPLKQHHSVVTTQTNSFGLFRLYDEDSVPANDPEDQSGSGTFPGVQPGVEPTASPPSDSGNLFHPYPNESSWRVGDWYWNDGIQKSKKNFQSLIEIITDANFRPEDLRRANWASIDRELGDSGIRVTPHTLPSNSAGESQDWLPEGDGWMQRAITISVPFHRRSLDPGPRDYTISTFYRRSLLSTIRDKLSDPLRCKSFRFEPYIMRWRRSHAADDINVYGELFYSQAFVSMHRQLQDAPPDSASRCTLPRRIVALMFWSDATQLTSFGDAKLWPLYMYFGNESKYSRCKPTANLCSHVAYFQTVCVRYPQISMTNCLSFK